MKTLREWLPCTKCGLAEFRRNVVLGRGDRPADVILVGEAPGKAEDLRGEPFVGPAGRILRLALLDVERRLERKLSYYITNTLACRPTDRKRGPNREPEDDEIRACFPRLQATITLTKPRVVVALGQVASRVLTPRYPDVVTLFHPSYVARRGGTESTEYRALVRGLVDVFRGDSERAVME